MRRAVKLTVAALLSFSLGAPAFAADYDWHGLWQTTTGESRYEFSSCGDGGTQLCAKLVWVSRKAMKGFLGKALNTYAVYGAQHVAENTWKGPLRYQGRTTDSTLSFHSPSSMTISGCYLVICKQYDLVKMSN